MSSNLKKIKKAAIAASALAREAARIEEDRASWRHALAQSDAFSKQIKELAQISSAYSQIAKDIKSLQPAALSLGERYKETFEQSSLVMQAMKQWQESQRAQQESIRRECQVFCV